MLDSQPQTPAGTLSSPGVVRQPVVRVQRLLKGRAGGATASTSGIAFTWMARRRALRQHPDAVNTRALWRAPNPSSRQAHLRVHIQPKPCHPAGEERLAQGIIIQQPACTGNAASTCTRLFTCPLQSCRTAVLLPPLCKRTCPAHTSVPHISAPSPISKPHRVPRSRCARPACSAPRTRRSPCPGCSRPGGTSLRRRHPRKRSLECRRSRRATAGKACMHVPA